MKPVNINIDAGSISIMINDDPERMVDFNPLDILFADKFYELINVFTKKDAEYRKKMAEIDKEKEKDKHGLPVNVAEGLGLMRELCDFCRETIDELFGENTSQIVFEDARNLEQIEQFFTGVVPLIEEARKDRIKKYTKKKPSKVMK